MSEIDELRNEMAVLRKQIQDMQGSFDRMELSGGGFGGQIDRTHGNVMIQIPESTPPQIIQQSAPVADQSALAQAGDPGPPDPVKVGDIDLGALLSGAANTPVETGDVTNNQIAVPYIDMQACVGGVIGTYRVVCVQIT